MRSNTIGANPERNEMIAELRGNQVLLTDSLQCQLNKHAVIPQGLKNISNSNNLYVLSPLVSRMSETVSTYSRRLWRSNALLIPNDQYNFRPVLFHIQQHDVRAQAETRSLGWTVTRVDDSAHVFLWDWRAVRWLGGWGQLFPLEGHKQHLCFWPLRPFKHISCSHWKSTLRTYLPTMYLITYFNHVLAEHNQYFLDHIGIDG